MAFRTRREKSEYDKRRYRETRETRLAEHRAYYQANKDQLIAAQAQRADPEAKRAYDRAHNAKPEIKAKRAKQREAWRLRNAEKTRLHDKERSLVRRRARPDVRAREYMAILSHDPCAYCGAPSQQIDHIDPLVAGGDSAWANLTAACQRCNYNKRDRPLLLALGGSY